MQEISFSSKDHVVRTENVVERQANPAYQEPPPQHRGEEHGAVEFLLFQIGPPGAFPRIGSAGATPGRSRETAAAPLINGVAIIRAAPPRAGGAEERWPPQFEEGRRERRVTVSSHRKKITKQLANEPLVLDPGTRGLSRALVRGQSIWLCCCPPPTKQRIHPFQ